jgi:hypothetical protein
MALVMLLFRPPDVHVDVDPSLLCGRQGSQTRRTIEAPLALDVDQGF